MTSNKRFNIVINYPLKENRKSFDKKAAVVAARILFEELSPKEVDNLLNLYKIINIKNHS